MHEIIDATPHGITLSPVFRNISPAKLYEEALRYEDGSAISSSGALIVSSGVHTGRSPRDKRIVCENSSAKHIWWGDINVPLDEHTYEANRERAIDYLNSRTRLYIIDGYAGWDPQYRIKIRTICSRAYHALFMQNMLIQPTEEELSEFDTPDVVIYNAGRFPANRYLQGISSRAAIILNFAKKELVILGSEYAGEMKKGVFTMMHYLMPMQNVLSMHCAATLGDTDDAALFFGLSGTGKTTLSSDPSRRLIGDDEHCWTDTGVFNIEGGCYAKCINPPDEILHCMRFGTLLENVAYDEDTRIVDYDDSSITENTRAAYPIDYVSNTQFPCIAEHPKCIIFLTCDAFGVLPPVSKLNEEQAMYHFISGYTAKISGTEDGITEPQATFSPCFGAAFLPLPPPRYAKLLAEKIKKHSVSVWLVNTGWTGGGQEGGSRMPLKITQTIIRALLSGKLDDVSYSKDSDFGFLVPDSCPNVDAGILHPEKLWKNTSEFRKIRKNLVELFRKNFAKYADEAYQNGGPS